MRSLVVKSNAWSLNGIPLPTPSGSSFGIGRIYAADPKRTFSTPIRDVGFAPNIGRGGELCHFP
jgi:hypothetical protein